MALECFNLIVCKFDTFNITLKSHEDIEWIVLFSENFKIFTIFIDREFYDNIDRISNPLSQKNSVTEILTISGDIRIDVMTLLMNIFSKISILELRSSIVEFDDSELVHKISLPKMHTIYVQTSRDLKLFSRSIWMVNIISANLDDTNNIDSIIDPT